MIYIFESTLERCRCFQRSRRAWEMFLFRRWEKAANGGRGWVHPSRGVGYEYARSSDGRVYACSTISANRFTCCQTEGKSALLRVKMSAFSPFGLNLLSISRQLTRFHSTDNVLLNFDEISHPKAGWTSSKRWKQPVTENSIFSSFNYDCGDWFKEALYTYFRFARTTQTLQRIHTGRALISTRFASRSRIFPPDKIVPWFYTGKA